MRKDTSIFRIDLAGQNYMIQNESRLPDPVLVSNRLSDSIRSEYLEVLDAMPNIEAWTKAVSNDLHCNASARGYIVLDIGPMFEHPRHCTFFTALLAYVGLPIRVFERWDLWKPIQTNIDVEPMRAGGLGLNPLHIDFVNCTAPPDFSCLLCVREDPAGGGANMVSNVQAAVIALTESDRELLSQAVFHEGKFYDLSGIGHELNPFPILEKRHSNFWFVRFTAKMTLESQCQPHLLAAKTLGDILFANKEVFHLKRGQLLVTNQNIVCHGRLPLGSGQELISVMNRRELRQIFLRAYELSACTIAPPT